MNGYPHRLKFHIASSILWVKEVCFKIDNIKILCNYPAVLFQWNSIFASKGGWGILTTLFWEGVEI